MAVEKSVGADLSAQGSKKLYRCANPGAGLFARGCFCANEFAPTDSTSLMQDVDQQSAVLLMMMPGGFF